MDNLRWAKKGASEDEIIEVCRLANADIFIDSFPDGYDTIIGDRGVRLSGGQAQRISLARAIIRKPKLLILDEATSSLDSRSEKLIQESIEIVAKTTTTLVIAHRLSTIKNSDYIYVLSGGRLAEEGTYKELVKMNGSFTEMVETQLLD
jgi:ABC-type multidrug transport system fused ATPase/permease subunit